MALGAEDESVRECPLLVGVGSTADASASEGGLVMRHEGAAAAQQGQVFGRLVGLLQLHVKASLSSSCLLPVKLIKSVKCE